MALEKTVSTPHGFLSENSYHRVENIKIRNKNTMDFHVKSYKSKNDLIPFNLMGFGCAYSIDGENPISQAYAHLKTLPEFAGAIDC